VAAIVLGGLIGWEREVHAKAAGLRTHIMIALASCLFTLITFELMAMPDMDEATLRTDPLRLIDAVTAGVAFLAAGTIIVAGAKVQGLTTGAGMWMAGAVGLACGIGNLALAGMATFLAVTVLWLLRALSDRLASRARPPDEP
ncbi:MAG: MgtC/SapB family protein, partial [Paracoccaceae bacterium]